MSTRALVLLAFPLEAAYVALRLRPEWMGQLVEYLALYWAAFLFYLVCCQGIGKKNSPRAPGGRWRLAWVWGAGLAFRLTLAPLYPSLSDDLYRYRWHGQLQAAGGNPYGERPADPRWAALRDRAWPRVNRQELPSAYGPLLELSYRWTWAAVSRLESDEFRQVRLFKLPYLLLDLGTAGILVMLLRRLGLPPESSLVYLWSPLVVVEFWASGHNDSLALLFVVAAVWAGCSGRWGWAWGALWMGALSKFWPAALFPLFWASSGRGGWLRRAGLCLAWTPLAALIASPYWHGAAELPRMLAGFLGGWRNNASLYNWIYAAAGEDYERGKPVVAVLAAAVVLLIAWKRPSLPEGVLWTLAALLALSANCFPWYLTWLSPFLAVSPWAGLLLWQALAPLSYHVLFGYQIDGRWREDPFYLLLEYVPVYAMLAAEVVFGRARRRAALATAEDR